MTGRKGGREGGTWPANDHRRLDYLSSDDEMVVLMMMMMMTTKMELVA